MVSSYTSVWALVETGKQQFLVRRRSHRYNGTPFGGWLAQRCRLDDVTCSCGRQISCRKWYVPDHFCQGSNSNSSRGVRTDEFPTELWKLLATRCVTSTALMGNHLEPLWLLILGNIAALGRSQKAGAEDVDQALRGSLSVWRRFDTFLGLKADDSRQAQLDRMGETVGRQIISGCGWYKCPLHLATDWLPFREALVCSGCKKVRLFLLRVLTPK